jgi:predicted TIM-barrel fold metal-dependent hydrolase
MDSWKTYNKSMAVLDAHTHMFPPEIIRKREQIASKDRGFSIIYGISKSRMIDGEGVRRYLNDEALDNVVVLGFPFEDNGLIREANDYLLDIAEIDRRIIPLVAVSRRDEAGSLSEAERCLSRGARGVGELAYYDTGFSNKERKGLEGLGRYLGERNAILVLHLNEQLGHDYPGKMPVDFLSVARFVEDHPRLNIILAHMGGGICFYEFMPEIAKSFSRVYYDLAAAPFLYSNDLYRYSAEFLSSKVLFGSDYPLLSYARYKPFLEKVTEEARCKIIYENGRKLFGT